MGKGRVQRGNTGAGGRRTVASGVPRFAAWASAARLAGAWVAVALLMGACASDRPLPRPAVAVGQVWAYETRSNERDSRAIVGHIEDLPDEGRVIHVKLTNLKLRNPAAPSGFSPVIVHAPVTQAAFLASVRGVVVAEPADLRGFAHGYDRWRTAHTLGEAGVFEIGLAEIVDEMERQLAR